MKIKKFKNLGYVIKQSNDGLFELRTAKGRLVSLFEDYLLAVNRIIFERMR